MERLIDADALREGIACHKQYTDQEYETDRQWALGYNAGIERALFSITYAHTIDAEPVRHGRWLKDKERNTYCSCCDTYIPVVHCHQDYQDYEYDWDEEIEETNYCPNCGAKMDATDNNVGHKDGGAEDGL